MVLKLRVLGCEAKILVEMSVRRRGAREYSVERARRMSFLARVEVVFSQLALTVFWKDFRPSTGVALLQLVEESSICVFKAAWRRNFLLPAI